MPLVARIWLLVFSSDTSPAPVVAMLNELVMIWPPVGSVTPPAVVVSTTDPTFTTPPLAIVMLGALIASRSDEPAVTVPTTLGAVPSVRLRVPAKFRLPMAPIEFVAVSVAPPPMVPRLTSVPASIAPDSAMPPVAPRASVPAVLTVPPMPMVPADSVTFGPLTSPATERLPVSVRSSGPPLTATVPRTAMVLVPVSVAPPAIVPMLVKVAAEMEPVSAMPPALAPSDRVVPAFTNPWIARVPGFSAMFLAETVPICDKVLVPTSVKSPPVTAKLARVPTLLAVPARLTVPVAPLLLFSVATLMMPAPFCEIVPLPVVARSSVAAPRLEVAASDTPPAPLDSASRVPAFSEPVIPMVPAVKEKLAADSLPVSERLPVLVRLTSLLAAKVPMAPMVLLPFSVTPPPMVPTLARVPTFKPPVSVTPPAVAPSPSVPGTSIWPGMLSVLAELI